MTPTATLEAAREALTAAKADEATRAAEHAAAREPDDIARLGAELEAARRALGDAERALAAAEEAARGAELARVRRRLEGAVRAADRPRFFARLRRTIDRLARLLAWRFEDSADHFHRLPRLVRVSPVPDPYLPAREHRQALATFVADEPERAALLRAVRKAAAGQNEAIAEADRLAAELGATVPAMRAVTETDVMALVVLAQVGEARMPRNWWLAWGNLSGRRLSAHESFLMERRGVEMSVAFARALVVRDDFVEALAEVAPAPPPAPYVSPLAGGDDNRARLGWDTLSDLMR